MARELFITFCGALSITSSGYLILGIVLLYLPMEPPIRQAYTIGWFTAKWPALLYSPLLLVSEYLNYQHITFGRVLISSTLLLVWWGLRNAGGPGLTGKIKRHLMAAITDNNVSRSQP